MDAAAGMSKPDIHPRPGDFSLCGKCGEILVFSDNLTQRAADLNDLLTLGQNEGHQLTVVQQVIRQHRFIK